MGTAAGVLLALGTLASEDAATLSAGVLVAAGAMAAPTAIGWVAFGIWIGDLGLFALGRLARRSGPVARWVGRRWSSAEITAMELRFNRGAPMAIMTSRFLPGTRVLLYLAAGACQVGALTFAIAAAVASLAWTAVIVSAAGAVGGWR
jgi:membrane protein DedA with SNARE-associated domain